MGPLPVATHRVTENDTSRCSSGFEMSLLFVFESFLCGGGVGVAGGRGGLGLPLWGSYPSVVEYEK